MSAQSQYGNFMKNSLALIALGLTFAACSPKVYVIDNQTVLEEEAAGTWPQFEKQILDKSKAKGPAPISQVPPDKNRRRLYNVMNGEMALLAKAGVPNTTAPVKGATSVNSPNPIGGAGNGAAAKATGTAAGASTGVAK